MIQLFQPQLGLEELEAVRNVFASNWIGRGPQTDTFEAALADRIGVPRCHVLSVSCCTAGIELIVAHLDLGPGDEVILPTISFVGAANAVAARGAVPVFADVDGRTLNLTAAALKKQISPQSKAVILLHYGGRPCAEFDEIATVCRERHLTLIEDNACSPFSRWKSRSCGTLADYGVWSFDAMKLLAIGDGGLVYCKDPADAEQIQQRAYLGLETPSGYASRRKGRWWEFEISSFGGRAIMNDITAAIGIEQLKKVDQFLARRRDVVEYYDRELGPLDWLDTPPPAPAESEVGHYFYWIQTKRRDALADWLREHGIYTTFRYHPLHTVAAYHARYLLPCAERAAARGLLLPLHTALSDDDVGTVIRTVKEFHG